MSSPLDSLIEEVDEDLRRDKAVALFRRFGPYLIALALGVIIAVAGVMAWRQYKTERDMERATTYAAAIDAINRGDTEQASSLLGQVTGKGAASGYGALARLQDAALKARAGDSAGAATVYDGIAADTGVDPLFRDLAQVLSALTVFDTADPAQ
ncbi:MAG TPA: tetratricopeptide repeat protein, partial [Alphaproteobacteria bacterium]|nr:tetratricopeptide repeat protein [Alphaproteobacteria bacterium]